VAVAAAAIRIYAGTVRIPSVAVAVAYDGRGGENPVYCG